MIFQSDDIISVVVNGREQRMYRAADGRYYPHGVVAGTETHAWHGWVRVLRTYRDGHVEVDEFPNLITNAGHALVCGALQGAITDSKIKYVALGTSSTTPAAGDAQLGAEAFRKAVTKFTYTAGASNFTTTVYIAPSEANIAIAEIGWFAGSSATSSANTGTLVAHVLYSHTHTNLESIQIDRTDTFN